MATTRLNPEPHIPDDRISPVDIDPALNPDSFIPAVGEGWGDIIGWRVEVTNGTHEQIKELVRNLRENPPIPGGIFVHDDRQKIIPIYRTQQLQQIGVAGMFRENPKGEIDGENRWFTLENRPAQGSLQVFMNGLLLEEGEDYTFDYDTLTIAFGIAPIVHDTIRCCGFIPQAVEVQPAYQELVTRDARIAKLERDRILARHTLWMFLDTLIGALLGYGAYAMVPWAVGMWETYLPNSDPAQWTLWTGLVMFLWALGFITGYWRKRFLREVKHG